MKTRLLRNILKTRVGIISFFTAIVLGLSYFTFENNLITTRAQPPASFEKTKVPANTSMSGITSAKSLAHSEPIGEGHIETKNTSLSLRIAQEAFNLYEFEEDPAAIDKRIQDFTAAMTPAQVRELEVIALNEHGDADQRLVAVYYLTQAGAKAQSSLWRIFINPTTLFKNIASAHSIGEEKQNLEISLRTMALQAMEENIYQSQGRLQIPDLTNINLPMYLQGLYKMVAVGKKADQPLLKKFINETFENEKL